MYCIGQLIDEHAAMEAVADQLIHLARAQDASAQCCHDTLQQLSSQLTEHLAAEAAFLYDEHDQCANAADDDAFPQEVTSFEEDFRELATTWQGYLNRWDGINIAANRSRFAFETVDMMTALKVRIARENDILYPLAYESGRVSLVSAR